MSKCAVVIKGYGGMTIGVATFCHSNVHVYKQCLICSDGTTSCPQPRCILHDAVAIEPMTSMAYAKENGSLKRFVRNNCMQAEIVGVVCNTSRSQVRLSVHTALTGPCHTVLHGTLHRTGTVQYGTV